MRLALGIAGVVLVVAAGCGDSNTTPVQPVPTAPTAAAVSPDALFERWKTLVNDPKKDPNTMEHRVIATELSSRAPEYLDRMVDMLTDPATTTEARQYVLDSLNIAQNSRVYPRLLQLTEPANAPEIRAGAATVLARAQSPEVVERLRKLAEDPERRVRLSAMCGLTEQGDAAMRAALITYYSTEGLPAAHRTRIIQSLVVAPQPGDAQLLTAALGDATLSEDARMMAVGGIVRLNDPASVTVLEECVAAAETPATVKQLAQDALNVMKKVQEQKAAAATQAPVDAPAAQAPADAPAPQVGGNQ